jgi:hypothetical protein
MTTVWRMSSCARFQAERQPGTEPPTVTRTGLVPTGNGEPPPLRSRRLCFTPLW